MLDISSGLRSAQSLGITYTRVRAEKVTDRRQKDAHIPTDIYEVSGGFNDLWKGRENHSRKGGGRKNQGRTSNGTTGGGKSRNEVEREDERGENSRKEVEKEEGRGKNQGRK